MIEVIPLLQNEAVMMSIISTDCTKDALHGCARAGCSVPAVCATGNSLNRKMNYETRGDVSTTLPWYAIATNIFTYVLNEKKMLKKNRTVSNSNRSTLQEKRSVAWMLDMLSMFSKARAGGR